VNDGRTDGQTDGRTPHDGIGRACIALRGKNLTILVNVYASDIRQVVAPCNALRFYYREFHESIGARLSVMLCTDCYYLRRSWAVLGSNVYDSVGQNGRRRPIVFNLSVRSSVRSFFCCQTCERGILKANEPILMPIGDRAFPVAAIRIWNSLSQHITSAPSLPVFCSRLKTYFFELCCPYNYCCRAREVTLSFKDTLFVLTYLLTYLLTGGPRVNGIKRSTLEVRRSKVRVTGGRR